MNELAFETSPYLLQHKNNPIYWKSWNEKALKFANTENKLIIVSIGYSACHWCHVMEHECFEDDDVANIMNANYISIKVDREERPDVDAVYMKALQLMTKQGGWPLNVVCLPDGRPVWGATYVNKQNWIDTLQQLQKLFESDKDKMYEYAEKLQIGINHTGLIELNEDEISTKNDRIEELIVKWKKSFDWEYGGHVRAPKFMMPTNLIFLQNYGAYYNDNELLEYVDLTLQKMTKGGLFDVVDGGFSRYSVDLKWHIPHFEKMLYDNAQLLQTYALAFKRTKNELYKKVCYKTFNFIKENWIINNGLVQSAYDADSIDRNNKLTEGAYYYWTINELKEILKNEYTWFSDLYNINEFGHWEHDFYVLIQTLHLKDVAFKYKISELDLEIKNDEILKLLKKNRVKNRIAPRLDDKCLTAWNAMFTIGCIECFEAFNDEIFLQTAEKNTNTILNVLVNFDTGTLYRNYKNEKIKISGFLDDYAFFIKALLKLYFATFNEKYLHQSKQLADYVIDNFYNENIGLFEYKNKTDEKLIAKHFEIEDNVIPSSNAIMGYNLWILSLIFDNNHYNKICKKMVKIVTNSIDYPSAFSEWLGLEILIQNNTEHKVIVGDNARKLVENETKKFNSFCLIFATDYDNELPIYKFKYKKDKNISYTCNNISCIEIYEKNFFS